MNVHSYLVKLRENAGLTQLQLSKRTGASERAIRNWERGIQSPEYEKLAKIARELCHDPQEHDLLFTLAGFHGAPPEVFPNDDEELKSYLSDYAEEVMDCRHPAFVRDAGWNVLVANPAFGRFILSLTGEREVEAVGWNIFVNVVFNPVAQDRLRHWNELWRIPMLCQLACELRASPGHSQLRRLEEAVNADPDTGAVYRTVSRDIQRIEHAVHFDGARLPLNAGELRTLKVRVRKPLAWQHRGLREVRWTASG
ncbi:helix-turn-helix domain-containing protein [Streptomyces botrytidirepellens]|uniref:helix-turn-helix domain-containing protein n=1 Tax=Streptomyces botrytidirepellens TaxID=2486417 RepID=UPI0016136B97|nr:helix-turn-helix domain-containing protein [Streptomyces botrytidirepellens]